MVSPCWHPGSEVGRSKSFPTHEQTKKPLFRIKGTVDHRAKNKTVDSRWTVLVISMSCMGGPDFPGDPPGPGKEVREPRCFER